MKKRILSLLLALVIIIGILPAPTNAADDNTDYSANAGKKARFDLAYTQFPIVSNPTSITAANVFGMDIAISKDVIPAELVVEIVTCYVNEAEGIYWYQIKAVEGHALPAEFPAEPWVFQNYIGVTGGESLIIIEDPESTKPETPTIPPVQILEKEIDGTVITVSGSALEEGLELKAERVDITQLEGFPAEMHGLTSEHFTMDISLRKDGQQWQPGAPVTVTIPSELLGYADGQEFIVNHLHTDATGVERLEWLGTFTVQNGEASFPMDSFSTITVEKNTGTMKIEGVGAFFEAYSATTGNSNYKAVGVYADADGNIHVIMEGMSNNTPNKALEYVKIIQSDTVPPAEEDIITVNNPTSAVEKGIKKVELYRGTELVGSLSPSDANGSSTWFWDINVGKIDIHGDFGIVVKCTTGQEGNSFNTGETDQGGTAITIPIYYNIVKEVYSVDEDTNIRGDGIKIEADAQNIVYKITVTNSNESKTDLQGAVVTDILPNIFENVKVSEDNETWTDAVISGSNEITLTEGLILKPGASKDFFIQADFADNIAPGAYDNIATLTGKLIEGDTDPSGIILPPAKAGNLKISKTVTGDRAPEQSFEFVVDLPGGIACYYEVFDANNEKVSNGTITSGGIIKIADGQYALIQDIPVGEYKVTEKAVENFTVTSTGATGSIVDKETAVASFVNAYTHPLGDLKIVKRVINNAENDLQNQSFTFTVVMPEGTALEPNTVTAVDGNGDPVTITQIAGSNSFQLDISVGNVAANENQEAFVIIRDLPPGSYVITESEKNRYEPNFQETGTAVYTAVVKAAEQTTATCVNTYPVYTGHLEIQKMVAAVDGYTAPSDQEFTFTVTGEALTRAGYMVSVDEGAEVLYPVTDGKLVLTLKAGQTALIKNLNPYEYQVVETPADGYVLTNKTGDSGTIAVDTTAEASFTNTYVPRGSLKVTKFVEKAFEADVVPENQEFTFTVTIPEDIDTNCTSYAYTKYHVGSKIENDADDVADESGTLAVANNTLTFTLQDGQYIVIEDLPVGAVTVTEAKIDGFDSPRFGATIDAVQSGGTGSFTGTIAKDETTTAVCVNTYQRTTGTLILKKIVVSPDGVTAPDQDFEFLVELIPPVEEFIVTVKYTDKDGNQAKADETITVSDGKFDLTLQDGWTATVENLPASHVTVTEKAYDDFQTDWETNGNVGFVRSGQNLELTCTNTYAVTKGNLMISKTVNKAYDRDVIPANEEYTIKVVFREESTPIEGSFTYKVFNKNDDPETISAVKTDTISSGDTLTLKADQFAMIYDVPVCSFDVEETGSTSGLDHYDIAYVHSEGHQIVAGKTVTSEITNTYKRHLGTLTINKTVTGTTEQDLFIFHIKGTDTSNSHIDMDVTITGSGSVKIYDLPLGSYTVTEDTDWSWRYNLSSSDTTDNTITLDDLHAVVTFTNTHENDMWLNYTANMPNVFGKKEDE